MCGFAGFLGGEVSREAAARAVLDKMTTALIHRGPDGSGFWGAAQDRIWLGHRRLSILDLSAAGHQPMPSPAGRYVIAFNGEIYNHEALRADLKAAGAAPAWRGRSDTETLLAGFDAWGVRETLRRAIGMFAFAVWDKNSRTLTLARDRLGEKPLYYGWQGDGFLFGSELKALRAHPAFLGEIDRRAVGLLLRHNAIPAPLSIYRGIRKLEPGCLLSVSLAQRVPETEAYWSAALAAQSGAARPFSGSPQEAVDELEKLLLDAVSKQMIADVPVGAFLSGGVDSSTVVALMRAQSQSVKTFSIGFREEDFSEAKYARAVAAHLRTDHTEMYVTAKEALDVIPRLPTLYDEPFADSSQIPTFLVAQLARRKVSVSLSGDGGDELFCGYNRYFLGERLWRLLAALPRSLRRGVTAGLLGVSPEAWNRAAATFSVLAPRRWRHADVGGKLHKLAGVLEASSLEGLYRALASHWPDLSAVVIGWPGLEDDAARGPQPELSGLDPIQRMMALDMLTYLPDDILVKVDRAAMGVSLETRTPLLDHRVVEFAWRLPQSMKLREGQTKWALRQVLYRHVPKALIERPKMGFGVPIDAWLRGPLREWAEDLLNERRLRGEGFFHCEPIRVKWREHLSGRRNWQYHLWDVLMFQAWLRAQSEAASAVGAGS